MATVKFTSVPSKRLAESITGASTSFKVNSIAGWDGVDLTSADFGTRLWVVFRNSAGTLMEIMEVDPATITAASSAITIITRGLKFTGDQSTSVAGNKLTWVKGDTIIELGSHVPQLLEMIVRTVGDQTIAGIKTFSSSPVFPSGGSGTQAATMTDIANAITGFTGLATNLVAGTLKLSVAAASGGNPIAVGDNDSRIPTAAQVGYIPSTTQKDALAGTGTPSGSNKYVTADTDALKELLANKDTDVALAANSDTKYPSQKAVKAYIDAKVLYKTGVVSKDMTGSDGATTTIPHGLGVIPKLVKMTAFVGSTSTSAAVHVSTIGTYASGVYAYICVVSKVGSAAEFFNGTDAILLLDEGSSAQQKGTITTLDATNIIITWAKSNSPNSTAEILWEAWGQ